MGREGGNRCPLRDEVGPAQAGEGDVAAFDASGEIFHLGRVAGGGGGIEIGHFAYVIVPDHTAETGVMRVIDPNDATGRGLPEDGSARLGTQFATWTADFHVIALR